MVSPLNSIHEAIRFTIEHENPYAVRGLEKHMEFGQFDPLMGDILSR